MRGRRIGTWLLTAALVAGMLPTTVYAAVGDSGQEPEWETAGDGYGEGIPRGRHVHTEECYTDELICTKAEGIASASNATGSNADTEHEHTKECYRLDCPYKRAKLRLETRTVVAGGGYSFETDDGKLTISNDSGTTAWRDDSGIEKENVKSVVVEDGVRLKMRSRGYPLP